MTKDTRKEGYTELIPSKVTEIYHRDLEDESNKLCKRFLKLVEEGKLDGLISYLKRLDR